MDLEYRILEKSDLGGVMALLERDFVARAPVTMFFDKPDILLNMHRGTVKNCLPHKVSMGAFDRTSGTLVAMCLGNLDQLQTPEIGQATSLGRQLMAVNSVIFDDEIQKMLGTKSIEYSILCTKIEYSNLGIASELLKRCHDLAMRRGCIKAYMLASNHYTTLMAKKFNYVFARTISYQDYVDPVTQTKIFENIPEPHKFLVLAVKEFED